jgi:hypothetical protein
MSAHREDLLANWNDSGYFNLKYLNGLVILASVILKEIRKYAYSKVYTGKISKSGWKLKQRQKIVQNLIGGWSRLPYYMETEMDFIQTRWSDRYMQSEKFLKNFS